MRFRARDRPAAACAASINLISYADAAATRDWATTYAERTLHSNLADKALEYGIATRAEIEKARSNG